MKCKCNMWPGFHVNAKDIGSSCVELSELVVCMCIDSGFTQCFLPATQRYDVFLGNSQYDVLMVA